MEGKTIHERDALLLKIEMIILEILEALRENHSPIIKIKKTNWENIYSNQNNENKEEFLNIDFMNQNSRPKFSKIIFVLSKIYQLVLRKENITERELFYQNRIIFDSQQNVCRILNAISGLVKISRWKLGVKSTAKGLIAGPCDLKLTNGAILDCRKPGGILIPYEIEEIDAIESTARMILIIEKDACFQKLIEEGVEDCILVTGKGFPDVATRRLVHRLWLALELPVVCLVDADPHGIAIMLNYRYGSLTLAEDTQYLAVPAIKWIGLHPSEVIPLGVARKPLTQCDRKMLKQLLSRPYLKDHARIEFELKTLQELNSKVELEALVGTRSSLLSSAYVFNQLSIQELI